METKKKVLFFILTTLILGTITYLIIRNMDKGDADVDTNENPESEVTEAVTEKINYEKYIELRSKAHDAETYAIVLYAGDEEISNNYLEEVKQAFVNRKAVVYLLDTSTLNDEELSGVIDDVTGVMKYKEPEFTAPTTIIMSKGSVVYSQAGFVYKEVLMDNLNAKSVE